MSRFGNATRDEWIPAWQDRVVEKQASTFKRKHACQFDNAYTAP